MTTQESRRLPEKIELAISEAKIRDYLLSTSHPVARHKARFFRSLGFDQQHWALLMERLQEQARLNEAELVVSEYGRKFVFRTLLTGPNGRSAELVSVWILVDNGQTARFVTAYPKE